MPGTRTSAIRQLRRAAAMALAVFVATVGAVFAPVASSPALADQGVICFGGPQGWPKFPAGSLYITSVHPWWPFPFYFPPPLGCPDNGINADGIQALTYATPGSVNEGTIVCWRWTELITTSSALPPPKAYKEGFLTAPQCMAKGNVPSAATTGV